MRKKWLCWLLIFGMLIPFGGVLSAEEDASSVNLLQLDGKTIRLDDFLSGMKGKLVVLNFWATWCPMCSGEITSLSSLYQDYRGRGVEVVGISLDEGGTEIVSAYVRRRKIPYPVVIGDEAVADAFGGIPGVPVTFLITRDGKVVRQLMGAQGRRRLEKAVSDLI